MRQSLVKNSHCVFAHYLCIISVRKYVFFFFNGSPLIYSLESFNTDKCLIVKFFECKSKNIYKISDFCDLEEHQSCMPVEISNFFVENILQTKIKLSCLKKRK